MKLDFIAFEDHGSRMTQTLRDEVELSSLVRLEEGRGNSFRPCGLVSKHPSLTNTYHSW
jgi:hypothetical protein